MTSYFRPSRLLYVRMESSREEPLDGQTWVRWEAMKRNGIVGKKEERMLANEQSLESFLRLVRSRAAGAKSSSYQAAVAIWGRLKP